MVLCNHCLVLKNAEIVCGQNIQREEHNPITTCCPLHPCKGIITSFTLLVQYIRAHCLVPSYGGSRLAGGTRISVQHMGYTCVTVFLQSILFPHLPQKMFMVLPCGRTFHCGRGADKGWMKFSQGSLLPASPLSQDLHLVPKQVIVFQDGEWSYV